MVVFIQHHATVKWGSRHILRIKMTVTINTMLNLDGDFDIHEYSDVTCKHTFRHDLFLCPSVNLVGYYCLCCLFTYLDAYSQFPFPNIHSQINIIQNVRIFLFQCSAFLYVLVCISRFVNSPFVHVELTVLPLFLVCVFSFSTFFTRIFLLCTPIQ